MFKVLVANRFSQAPLLILQKTKGLDVHAAEDISQLKSHWPDAQGLLIRSGTKVTRELLSKMPNLKVVISATSGFDHIDLKDCADRGIIVMHTPQANAASAAEHTWGLILASQRKYQKALQQLRSGDWNRAQLVGHELAGRTLGVIGYGHIGRRVYNIARAFEMKVLVHDPYVDQDAHPGISFLGYEEVVRDSDIVTYHVPLTSETYHMIKESTLEWFHEDATLVNASRGDVVCMSSLLHHMAEHPDFKVALDVFPTEPLPPGSALLGYKNVFCTPHIGATTAESIARASQEAIEKMILFVQSGAHGDTLPPRTLWAEKLI